MKWTDKLKRLVHPWMIRYVMRSYEKKIKRVMIKHSELFCPIDKELSRRHRELWSRIGVSTGMGGVKMVRDFGYGLVFNNEDANDLALKLESLIKDESVYKSCVSNVPCAISHCSAEFNAKRLISIVRGI